MTLLADVDWLWRESTQDAIYGPAILPLMPAADAPGPVGPPLSTRRYIGRQLTADWAWQASRHIVLEFTYAWLPAGD